MNVLDGLTAVRVMESAARALRRTSLIAAVSMLCGCAATQVQRAEQIGALGKAYTDAVSAAGQEALASTVAFSLEEIVKERRGGAFRTPEARDEAVRDEMERLQRRQKLVVESDAQVALLGEYFASLQAFAKQDVATPVEAATSSLTESINKLGLAIENNPEAKAKLTDGERGAIAKLAGQVARQIHGQALAGILERDAGMIGTQLKLLSKVLASYVSWIEARNKIQFDAFYRDSVVKPFVAAGDLPASWDKDARTYLRGMTLNAELVKAREAGVRMERFWASYLAGETSMSAILADLKEVQALLDAITALRKAREAT